MSLSLSHLVRPGGKYRTITKRLTDSGRLSGCQCAGLHSERICVEAFRWCEVNSGVEKRLAMVIMRFRRVGFRLWDEYDRWMRCDDGLHSKWKVAYLRAYSLPAYSLLHAAASLWD